MARSLVTKSQNWKTPHADHRCKRFLLIDPHSKTYLNLNETITKTFTPFKSWPIPPSHLLEPFVNRRNVVGVTKATPHDGNRQRNFSSSALMLPYPCKRTLYIFPIGHKQFNHFYANGHCFVRPWCTSLSLTAQPPALPPACKKPFSETNQQRRRWWRWWFS